MRMIAPATRWNRTSSTSRSSKAPKGLKVLEIGVGMGADYLEWLKAGAQATGVDLSATSIERARRRCELAGYQPDLRVADAEQLPFADNSFDVVYSYGVMHHSPDTEQCIREAWRVLKPGGQARIMVYHHPSMTGLMLWLRYRPLAREIVAPDSVRSLWKVRERKPIRGPKPCDARRIREVEMQLVFSPGDLLLHQPSATFQSAFYRLVWKIFPRALVRRFGRRWGLFLLITQPKLPSTGPVDGFQSGLKCTSHQRCSTYRDHGRDHEIDPLRNFFQTDCTSLPFSKSPSGPLLIRLASSTGSISRPQFLTHPMFERQREAPLRTMNNPRRADDPASASTKSFFGVPLSFPRARESKHRLGQPMIDEGNSQLQPLRHAHEIGVAQQSIEHVTARLEIRNTVDRIERKRALQPGRAAKRTPFRRSRHLHREAADRAGWA